MGRDDVAEVPRLHPFDLRQLAVEVVVLVSPHEAHDLGLVLDVACVLAGRNAGLLSVAVLVAGVLAHDDEGDAALRRALLQLHQDLGDLLRAVVARYVGLDRLQVIDDDHPHSGHVPVPTDEAADLGDGPLLRLVRIDAAVLLGGHCGDGGLHDRRIRGAGAPSRGHPKFEALADGDGARWNEALLQRVVRDHAAREQLLRVLGGDAEHRVSRLRLIASEPLHHVRFPRIVYGHAACDKGRSAFDLQIEGLLLSRGHDRRHRRSRQLRRDVLGPLLFVHPGVLPWREHLQVVRIVVLLVPVLVVDVVLLRVEKLQTFRAPSER